MSNFAVAPDWGWLVIGYLFCGGLAGGLFALGGILRFVGRPIDKPVSRAAFIASFPFLLVCPILLTFHLGEPTRFWHMLINVSDGTPTFVKVWSPMPLGAWALFLFGLCCFLMFLQQVVRVPQSAGLAAADAGTPNFASLGVIGGRRGLFPPLFEQIVLIAGLVFGTFLMGYTGVLLGVSSQRLWGDTWTIGGLFTSSALAASASVLVLITVLSKSRVVETINRLAEMLFYFLAIEIAMIGLTIVTAGESFKGQSGLFEIISIVLEVLSTALLVPLVFFGKPAGKLQRLQLLVVIAALVIIGGFLLRAGVVLGAQPDGNLR